MCPVPASRWDKLPIPMQGAASLSDSFPLASQLACKEFFSEPAVQEYSSHPCERQVVDTW